MPIITLTVDASTAARIAEAFGSYWNLQNTQGGSRNATLLEVKEYLVRHLKAVITQQERRKAENAITPVVEIVVT